MVISLLGLSIPIDLVCQLSLVSNSSKLLLYFYNNNKNNYYFFFFVTTTANVYTPVSISITPATATILTLILYIDHSYIFSYLTFTFTHYPFIKTFFQSQLYFCCMGILSLYTITQVFSFSFPLFSIDSLATLSNFVCLTWSLFSTLYIQVCVSFLFLWHYPFNSIPICWYTSEFT